MICADRARLRYVLAMLLGLPFIIAADCCDPNHDAYVVNQANVKRCEDRGGIGVVNVINDDGGHHFVVLATCTLPPCQPNLEKP